MLLDCTKCINVNIYSKMYTFMKIRQEMVFLLFLSVIVRAGKGIKMGFLNFNSFLVF